jgi:hypothetical protein
MAFDCLFIDFNRNNSNKQKILSRFPYAKQVSFVSDYFSILKSIASDMDTDNFWVFTDLLDIENFDYDFRPEQHESNQLHVWNVNGQQQGDVMLVPKYRFIQQQHNIKHLRDFEDINYHSCSDLIYDNWPTGKFEFNGLLEKIRNQQSRYFNYYYTKHHEIFPSFWEDQKLYVYGKKRLNMLVPRFPIKKELHEYTPKFFYGDVSENLNFDVVFIHNNEPQAIDNLKHLQRHIKTLNNKLHIVQGIKGRKNAYHAAAKLSTTEYFYAVFAKLKVDGNFKFDFVPDTLKSPRHYIFDCYNPVIDYAYGHQAVILYNKEMVLQNEGKGLDFTLDQTHDHIPILSAESLFYTDPLVCYRTAFREIVKLLYNKHTKPTVENNYILEKWLDPGLLPGASYVKAAGHDACDFVNTYKNNFEKLFQSYEWEYVDKKYKNRFTS